ncbi:hypothetical protein [Flavobacterium sp. NKUCC04_CG]|uniref:hypothetical protein n=1 Tax=Flavobacterium sp. NKUCC04_CG TaxID=2842121 RepID=UPI001C5BF4C9|nr:hypothetical protein [Flavobacterium sp. NKUCC04_CG]MBW3518726.1 hypothetical protein [Flavobacterium sp. NKUCC04_CG]
MKELDLLKKHWNKDSDFPKVSQDDIKNMIHKRSSSIVKWIFIISIIEFIILNLISLLMPSSEVDDSTVFIEIIDYASIGFSLVFIVLFYKNYRSISVSSSTKTLMQGILKTRKTVKIYIYINIFMVIIGMFYAIFVLSHTNHYFDKLNNIQSSVLILAFLAFMGIFAGIIWLVYKVIYGILLKKLKYNYTELKKIDF